MSTVDSRIRILKYADQPNYFIEVTDDDGFSETVDLGPNIQDAASASKRIQELFPNRVERATGGN